MCSATVVKPPARALRACAAMRWRLVGDTEQKKLAQYRKSLLKAAVEGALTAD